MAGVGGGGWGGGGGGGGGGCCFPDPWGLLVGRWLMVEGVQKVALLLSMLCSECSGAPCGVR
jgi:hypothetical protein